MKRAALYVRVSTQEQKINGMSVDSQIDALKKYCADNGYIIVDVYNDAGISARKKYTGRPALLRLLDDCKSGLVDIVLFTKLDRWFRSVADYYEVQSTLEKAKVPWRAIWEDYETETSSGIFKVNIMLSIAQAESDRTSERIKKVLDYKRENGGYVGSAPAGYKLVNKQLIVDEKTKAGMTAFFNEYALTYNITQSIRAAAAEGVTIRRRAAIDILRNKTYAGDAHGYKCYAYITQEQFEKNAIRMEPKTRTPKDPDRVYIFSGMIRCGICGRLYVARTMNKKQKSGKITTSIVYACPYSEEASNDHVFTSISELKVEKYLISHYNAMLAEAQEKYTAMINTEDAKAVEKKKKQLTAKLQRIGDRYEDGDISRDEYRLKRDEIKKELAEIESRKVEKLPEMLPDNWVDIYNELSKDGKKSFWRGVLSEIILTKQSDGSKDFKIIF